MVTALMEKSHFKYNSVLMFKLPCRYEYCLEGCRKFHAEKNEDDITSYD